MQKNRFVSLVIIAAAMLVPPATVADSDDTLPAILADEKTRTVHYLPDFSYAGYRNGSADVPAATGKVVLVDEFGAIANDGIDDSKSILDALSHAHSVDGPVVVRFGPGRYRVSEVLEIKRSDFVLQGHGSGTGGTTLHFPRPLKQNAVLPP